ncbi:MAG TPA: hypothetical protein VM532_17385 [Burkholderiales bacterium]|nr:hypothetical protein [Burkholderiales bacterium]
MRVKKDDLVKPMLTGWKEVRSDAESSKGRLGALVAALLIALAVVYGVSGAGMSETPPVNNVPGW